MKLVSGGQTGADRAALDFAIEHGFESGGWIPKGRLAEDGPISQRYSTLKETGTPHYPERTRLNIEHSDGTLIVFHGDLSGGSKLTKLLAFEIGKPCIHINFDELQDVEAARKVHDWIETHRIKTLNIAGPRASGDPHIYNATLELLTLLFV